MDQKMNRDQVKQWRDNEVYPVLRKYHLLESERDKKWFYLFAICFTLLVLLVAIMSFNGSFKPQLSQNISLTPNNTISNQYDFNPSTQNQYDFKPQITINIPKDFCKCITQNVTENSS